MPLRNCLSPPIAGVRSHRSVHFFCSTRDRPSSSIIRWRVGTFCDITRNRAAVTVRAAAASCAQCRASTNGDDLARNHRRALECV